MSNPCRLLSKLHAMWVSRTSTLRPWLRTPADEDQIGAPNIAGFSQFCKSASGIGDCCCHPRCCQYLQAAAGSPCLCRVQHSWANARHGCRFLQAVHCLFQEHTDSNAFPVRHALPGARPVAPSARVCASCCYIRLLHTQHAKKPTAWRAACGTLLQARDRGARLSGAAAGTCAHLPQRARVRSARGLHQRSASQPQGKAACITSHCVSVFFTEENTVVRCAREMCWSSGWSPSR